MASAPNPSTAHPTMTASNPTTTVSIGENRQLTYTEYGEAGGTPVLFLHGTLGSRRLGTLFDTAAREHGIRLLAPDRPGASRRGASSRS